VNSLTTPSTRLPEYSLGVSSSSQLSYFTVIVTLKVLHMSIFATFIKDTGSIILGSSYSTTLVSSYMGIYDSSMTKVLISSSISTLYPFLAESVKGFSRSKSASVTIWTVLLSKSTQT
jgi:hypothetical protein